MLEFNGCGRWFQQAWAGGSICFREEPAAIPLSTSWRRLPSPSLDWLGLISLAFSVPLIFHHLWHPPQMNHSHFCCHLEKSIGIQMHVFTGAISSKLKCGLLDKFIWLERSQWRGWIIFLMFQTQRWLHTYPLYLHHKSWKQFLAQLHLSFCVFLMAWFPCVDLCSLTA